MENKIEMLQLHHKIMNILKLTPKDGKKFTVIEKLRIGIFLSSFTVVDLCSGYHFIKNKQRNTIGLGEMVNDVADILATSAMILLCLAGVNSGGTALQFLRQLGDFSKFGKPPHFEELNRKLNIFSAFYISYGIVGAWSYYIFKISFNKSCQANNIKYNKSDLCYTMTATLLPFELEPPFDNIFRLVQVNSVAFSASIACAFVSYACNCSEIIVSKISHLKSFLEKVFADKDSTSSEEKLRFCVKYHNYIISAVDQFNAIFGKQYILIFLQNGPMTAIVGFLYILEPNMSTVIHSLAWLLGLFMSCFAGQRLIDESTSVADVAYNTEWYEADKSSQILIKMIILEAQRPLRQKVWKHGESSHDTFCQIMKTSYSVLAALNTMYN